jgi:hypothetical protein
MPFSTVVFYSDQCSSHFDPLSKCPATPITVPLPCALVFDPRLRRLVCPNLSSMSSLLILNIRFSFLGHSRSGKRSQNSSQHCSAGSYIRDSLGAIRQASFSLTSFQMDGVWNVGPMVHGWTNFGDVASSCRDSRILRCMFLLVSLASDLPTMTRVKLPYFRDTIQELLSPLSNFSSCTSGYDEAGRATPPSYPTPHPALSGTSFLRSVHQEPHRL